MADALNHRVRVQLALALLSKTSTDRKRAALIRDARRAGLTGAEIDAAMAGRSFSARTAAVIDFASALQSGLDGEVSRCRSRASALGITDAELQATAVQTSKILGRSL